MYKRSVLAGVGFGISLSLIVAGVSACGADSKKDAVFSCDDAVATPTDGGAPAKACHAPTHLTVFLMPDGFRNVAFGCNGKVGVYVTSRGWSQDGYDKVPSLPSSISTVNDDPNCP